MPPVIPFDDHNFFLTFLVTVLLQLSCFAIAWTCQFDKITDFMNGGASTDGFMLRMKVRDLDRKRKQNLRDVAPEFAEIIGYDYDQ